MTEEAGRKGQGKGSRIAAGMMPGESPATGRTGGKKGKGTARKPDRTETDMAEHAAGSPGGIGEDGARFRLLSTTAARLLNAGDPRTIITDLGRDVMAHLDCQVFFNYLVDDRAGRLHLNAFAGIPDAVAEKIERMDFGAAISGWVAENGTRIIVEDIQAHPEPRTGLLRSHGIQAYCCHPLMSRMRPIGTLAFGTKTRPCFTPDEVELMRIIADQVAVAVARIRSEQELRETSQYLENLINHANAPIIVWDSEFRITRFNHAFEHLTGWSAEEVVGRELGILFPEESRRESMEQIRRTMAGERWEAVEIPILNRSGGVRTVLWNSATLTGPDGTVISTIAQGQDITERKQAEEALLVSSKWLGMAQRAANAGFWDWDMVTGQLIWSPEFYRLFGIPLAEDASFDTWLAVLHPDDREPAMARINRSVRERTSLENEFRVLLPDGRERWIGAWGSTAYDGAGRPVRMSGICLDITERKLADEKIAHLASFPELNPSPILELDPAGEIIYTNLATERILGKLGPASPRALLPEDFPSILVQDLEEDIQREVRVGGRVFLENISRDPRTRTIRIYAQDITDLKRIGEALHDTTQQLENLINYANAPIIVWDPDLRITRFNHAFEWLTGRTAEEVMGRSLEILFPEATAAHSMDLIRTMMAGERWETVEIPILTREGDTRSVLWNSAVLYEPDGVTVSAAIAQGQDITGQKRMDEEIRAKTLELEAANLAMKKEIMQRIHAGEALERTMALLKATFESTADGILSIDADGVVAGFNQNFVSMWNVPFALVQTPDMDAIEQHMATQLVDPGGFLAMNADLRSHPGRERYDMLELQDGRIFERYSRPQRIEHEIVGRVWSYRDITERKRAEEKILASLNEKEVLLREIHHRVKNNLQLISGLLDLTRLRTRDPQTLGILTDMMLKIQTMAQIHTRLYESKQFDRINMGTQIRDQVASLSQIYGQKDREILCEVEGSDLHLPIDQAMPCALAVNEILSNAFKHAFRGRAHGLIRVRAFRENSRVRITVQDNGRGIPPDVDITRSPSLGLKLIRNLVENQLKGSLAIRREGGTEVIVEFPIMTQEGEHVADTRSGR